MATNNTEIELVIDAGPNEMQLMMSLMRPRPNESHPGINMDVATSVHFTTNLSRDHHISCFSVCIDGMARGFGSDPIWVIEGKVTCFSSNGTGGEFTFFRGHFNSRTRRGGGTLMAKKT
jgi:hypothetical protein